jgi:hypothetical protein
MAESESEHPDLDLPAGFRHALATEGLGLDFETLPLSSRRRYADWVQEPPDGERAARIAKAMEMIRAHQDPPAPGR